MSNRYTFFYFLVFVLILFICPHKVFAYNITQDLSIHGHLENYTAMRLFDSNSNNLKAGDLAQMRNTLFLDTNWRISDNLTFKGIARAFYDGASDINDRYNGYDPADEDYWPGPDEKRMGEQLDAREYYFKYYNKDLTLTVGRQQVVWGEADNLRMADMVNPLNLSWDWSFPDWEDIRVPLHLVRAEYAVPGSEHDLRFDLVWNPIDFRPQQVAPYGSNWDPNLPSLQVYEMVSEQYDHDLPDRSLSDTGEIGGRVQGNAGPFNLSLFGFYHRNDETAGQAISTYNPEDALNPEFLPVEFKWPYKTTVGGTVNYHMPSLATVFRGELAYDIDQPFSYQQDNSKFLSGDYAEKDRLSAMVGFDRNTWIRAINDYKTFYFSGQWFQSYVFDTDEGDLVTGYGEEGDDDYQSVLSLLVNTEYMNGYIVPEVVAVHSLTEECGFVDYSVKYKPTATLSIQFGARNIWGNKYDAGIWGPVRDNDQIYTKIKKTF